MNKRNQEQAENLQKKISSSEEEYDSEGDINSWEINDNLKEKNTVHAKKFAFQKAV